MLAAFPEDGPPFGEPVTSAGFLCGVVFVCIVLFGMSETVAIAVALRRNVAWRGHSAFSVIAAVAAFSFLFVLVFALRSRLPRGNGYFAVTVLWVEAMALRLRRLT